MLGQVRALIALRDAQVNEQDPQNHMLQFHQRISQQDFAVKNIMLAEHQGRMVNFESECNEYYTTLAQKQTDAERQADADALAAGRVIPDDSESLRKVRELELKCQQMEVARRKT